MENSEHNRTGLLNIIINNGEDERNLSGVITMRKKTSIFWQIDKDILQQVVSDCDSLNKILKHFGFAESNGNYGTLKRRLEKGDINFSHIKLGRDSNKGRTFGPQLLIKEYIEKYCVENSSYNRSHLKRRLLKEGILKNKCCICGFDGKWCGKPITLILDHINGVNNDHRLENLRMVCPMCNSQLETHCGKHRKKKYFCKDCGKEITKHGKSKLCKICSDKTQERAHYPPQEELKKLVEEKGYCAVGRMFGVTDNSIRKRLRKLPPLV